ncbi:hypothetical protein FRC06_007598, partial [Ceratobasidium sp. 370]
MDVPVNHNQQIPTGSQNVPAGVGRGAATTLVANRFAELALAPHDITNRTNADPAPLVVHPASHNLELRQPAPLVIDSDSDMPDVADIMRVVPAAPQQEDEGGHAAQPAKANAGAMPETVSKPARKGRGKSKGQDVEDKAATPIWAFDEFESLVQHIIESDELFKRARQKGANLSFWKRIAEELSGGKRTGKSTWHQWKKAERIYAVVKSLESFTGGGGDGKWTIDDDDNKETA